jgi:Ca2+-binding RTX toxin-like protein
LYGGVLTGGDGNDTLSAVTGATMAGDGTASLIAPGHDSLDGSESADSLSGGAGNDTLFGDDFDDTLLGGAGNDVLRGGTGSDRLGGGDGADTLDGGRGGDILRGGVGADAFLFNAVGNSDVLEVDVVVDFQPGVDRLNLIVETYLPDEDILDELVQVTDGGAGGPVLLQIGAAYLIVLQGVGLGDGGAIPYATSADDLIAAGWAIGLAPLVD